MNFISDKEKENGECSSGEELNWETTIITCCGEKEGSLKMQN